MVLYKLSSTAQAFNMLYIVLPWHQIIKTTFVRKHSERNAVVVTAIDRGTNTHEQLKQPNKTEMRNGKAKQLFSVLKHLEVG